MVRLAGLKENTLLFGGFSGSEVDALCFNTSRYSSCVLPGLRGEQIFFPACHRVSPRQTPKKQTCAAKATRSTPSTCLLPTQRGY